MAAHEIAFRSFVDFSTAAAPPSQVLARARHFCVEWLQFGPAVTPVALQSAAEALVIVSHGPVRVRPVGDDANAASSTAVPSNAVAIVPAGRWQLEGGPGGRAALITTHREPAATRHALNGQADADAADDPRAPAPSHRRLRALAVPQVLAFDDIQASPAKPRLKMLQTESLSINIVDYLGPRDRSALSPHSHTDFEQGSLAIHGNFVHHLRTPWGSDAAQWRDDEHLHAPSPSLVVIPTHVLHTTEGTGDGRHLLIDIFSPPRADFIASRWVFNADDYAPVAAVTA